MDYWNRFLAIISRFYIPHPWPESLKTRTKDSRTGVIWGEESRVWAPRRMPLWRERAIVRQGRACGIALSSLMYYTLQRRALRRLLLLLHLGHDDRTTYKPSVSRESAATQLVTVQVRVKYLHNNMTMLEASIRRPTTSVATSSKARHWLSIPTTWHFSTLEPNNLYIKLAA